MGRFRIKIRSSWFSDDYVALRYSTNGIFWKSVKEYDHEILENWCYMSTKTVEVNDAKYWIEKFNTIEKVKQYEAKQRNTVLKHNAEISERNRKHKENKRNAYKQYG